MLNQVSRKCNKCGYPVTWYEASDDYGYANGFTAKMTEGKLKGQYAGTDHCPKCGQELTLETTREVK